MIMKKIVNNIRLLGVFFVSLCIVNVIHASASAETLTLRVLSWEGYVYKDHQQAFLQLVKEKYGIDLELDFTYALSDDDFFPALRDGTADVITPSHHIAKDKRFRFIDLKLVLPLNLDNIPNYKHIFPSLQRADFWTEGDQVYGVPVYGGAYALAYNTALMAEAPTSWKVLWDPQYKGKYVLGEALYEQNVYITALAMGFKPNEMTDYQKLNTPAVQEKLAQLAVNARSLFGYVENADEMKGLPLAVIYGVALPELAKMGEIWKLATPAEGTTGFINPFMLSSALAKKPQLKQIAEEWINYLLSDEIQVYTVREMFCRPVTTTVQDKLTPEEVAQFHLDDPSYFEQHVILFPTLEKLDRKGIERLWEKALSQRK
jgi:spermidine/putrescine-binding protein